jgi:hypothetical protein
MIEADMAGRVTLAAAYEKRLEAHRAARVSDKAVGIDSHRSAARRTR